MKFLVMLGLAFASIATYAAEKIGDDAPVLEGIRTIQNCDNIVADTQAQTTKIEIQKGKFYIVEFWATWCRPCHMVIPHLGKISRDYSDSIIVIGVSLDQKFDVAEKFANSNKNMTYSVIHDASRKVSEAYMKPFNVRGIPHAFLIDAEGKIVWNGHPSGLDAQLKKFVGEPNAKKETPKAEAPAEKTAE